MYAYVLVCSYTPYTRTYADLDRIMKEIFQWRLAAHKVVDVFSARVRESRKEQCMCARERES